MPDCTYNGIPYIRTRSRGLGLPDNVWGWGDKVVDVFVAGSAGSAASDFDFDFDFETAADEERKPMGQPHMMYIHTWGGEDGVTPLSVRPSVRLSVRPSVKKP